MGNDTVYQLLPMFSQLSPAQEHLLKSLPQCGRVSNATECWYELSNSERATFFMITFALEHTTIPGGRLVDKVSSIEGILVGNRTEHTHMTGRTAYVDGWRLHLMLDDALDGAVDLPDWSRDRLPTHPTHTVFDYTEVYRDHRGSTGPFLQLVLTRDGTSSDSDLDLTKNTHTSSPRVVVGPFVKRYGHLGQNQGVQLADYFSVYPKGRRLRCGR